MVSTFSVLFLFALILIAIELWAFVKLYVDVKIRFQENVKVLDVSKLKFEAYLRDFNKSYDGNEYERRFQNFKASLKDIARLNALEGNAVFGLTKFSDMSKEEFVDKMLLKSIGIPKCYSLYQNCSSQYRNSSLNYRKFSTNPPTSFDWRTKGVVKPVLDQKKCQGCWAFSIVGVLESMAAIRGLDNKSRSIQELLDCSTYTNGCGRGSVSRAMAYICLEHLKFVTEEEYPMTLSVERDCKLHGNYSGRSVLEYAYQCYLDEDTMVSQIAGHGPLIVAVDASNWLNYIGGVIRRACFGGIANHVVQVVGYEGYGNDSDTSLPYYIVRNSMGEDFGEKGYVKIAMNGNVCGIADQVTMIDVI